MGKKDLVCYKYLIIDHQQTCFEDYMLTKKYYSSKKACERDWNRDNESKVMFRIVRPLLCSKQTGDMACALTRHERVQYGEGDFKIYPKKG